jgi:hypothetical protein
MILDFDTAHVKALLTTSQEAEGKRHPNMAQTFNPAFWREDLSEERRVELMKFLDDDQEGGIWPTEDDVDPAKVPAGLWLVGDQGIYLMSNAPFEQTKADLADKDLKHVCYAQQCDPTQKGVDDWYDVKRVAFGGDDGGGLHSSGEI